MTQNIKIWAQMFFEDGSVTQGMRIDAQMLDSEDMITEIARTLLWSVNREEGWLLVWGAGNMVFNHYPTSFSPSASSESNS